MKKEMDSPAVQLMEVLWRNSQHATGHSWLRLNQGLREGLFLAVKIGLEFHENDIAAVRSRFRGGYWFGDSLESFYHCAVTFGNSSAWKAYEAYVSRKPFIFNPAKIDAHYGAGGQGINNPPRLVVGARFTWSGEKVVVTSFNDEKGHMVAQSYTQEESVSCDTCGHQTTWPRPKTMHRYTITHEDLKKAKAAK